jgi:exonuclease-1
MYRVRMLRYHGITPFVVFDGGPLPAKQGTGLARQITRGSSGACSGL